MSGILRGLDGGNIAKAVALFTYNESSQKWIPYVSAYEETDGANKIIDFVHEQAHDGLTYFVSYAAEGYADDAYLRFVINVGAIEAHLIGAAVAGGNAMITFYEGTEITGGTAMAEYNKRRSSVRAATVAVIRDPATIPTPGTAIQMILLPGGTGGNAVGGSFAQREEWILKPNTQYILQIQNISGSAKAMGLLIEWYEHNLD